MSRAGALLFCLLFSASMTSQASVQLKNHQGESIELQGLQFTDENGTKVPLNRYFHSDRPVILVPIYFGCPGPCTVLLNQLVSTLKRVNLSAGRGYEMIILSIDPTETSSLALEKKETYVKLYERPETVNGWHFLTGSEPAIRQLTDQLGFEYERDPNSGAISHPSGIFILTSEGRISKILSGFTFSRQQIFTSLYQAKRGKIQVLFDRVNGFCSAYLPSKEFFYSPSQWMMSFKNLMQTLKSLIS